jgi:bifunctional non-homologous end joining protein LigD
MGLKVYRRRRKFETTLEPVGTSLKSSRRALRFVVQMHQARRLHFDLRLEFGGVLKSWAVPKGPSLNPLDRRLAILVEDHPLEYGSFEGVILPGNYGAGTVMVWDTGTYVARGARNRQKSEQAMKQNLQKGHLSFVLKGQKLKGEFALVKLKKGNEQNAWLLIKKRDSHASYRNTLGPEDNRSVKTGRSLDQITHESRRVQTRPLRHEPRFTHLDKVLWPNEKITKGALIQYYQKISPYILPYLKDRPESLHRFPQGIAAPGFYQKDLTGYLPRWFKTERVFSESANKSVDYALCQDERSLLYIVNLGCIEINPWLSRVGSLNYPDFLVIDLDPDGNSFDQVIEVAQAFHRILSRANIPNFCKTSGATGIHIGVPMGAKYPYEQVRRFAEKICRMVAKQYPATTSVDRNPNRRRRKIYLDFMQNRRGQTLAAPYCVRPRSGAPVSMPIAWEDLKSGLKPDKFNMMNALKIAKTRPDLWRGVLGKPVNLDRCMASFSISGDTV